MATTVPEVEAMMQNALRNPFDALDVSEVNLRDFVGTFSDVVLETAAPLFNRGNVVVKGMQGAGKSMLLGLLKPEIRIAYHESGTPFPVSADRARFICASINLTQSGVSAFGHRMNATPFAGSDVEIPKMFGDFLNYFLVRDLLETIQILSDSRYDGLAAEIGIHSSPNRLDDFARILGADECWVGAMSKASSYATLRETLTSRIGVYRAFLGFNRDTLPPEIKETKTDIGAPLSAAARALYRSGVIEEDVSVFAAIDQFEELLYQRSLNDALVDPFREIFNTAFGSRDPSISYRVGSRAWAWNLGNLKQFGTEKRLESGRDYIEVDLDSVMRRSESAKDWVFPKLAEDIFRRRLVQAGYTEIAARKDPLAAIFGNAPSAEQRAVKYAGKNPEKLVKISPKWPEPFKQFLLETARTSPLEAKLAEAWVQQRGKHETMNAENFRDRPWNAKQWWKKERIPQALVQIAGRRQQALLWSGKQEILALSGGNVLVFLGICRHIWEAWLRSIKRAGNALSQVLPIDEELQAGGILRASEWWLQHMIPATGADGEARKRFLLIVGTELSSLIANDEAMSNPGAFGFSLPSLDLGLAQDVEHALGRLSDFGDIYAYKHTTKNSTREPRQKWYVIPIVSPLLRLPHQHVKEPLYCKVEKVERWLKDAGVISTSMANAGPKNKLASSKNTNPGQMDLFKE
ncbi:hypothetical protein SB778_31125 [Paraburkholderia sp. SIMBA_050]